MRAVLTTDNPLGLRWPQASALSASRPRESDLPAAAEAVLVPLIRGQNASAMLSLGDYIAGTKRVGGAVLGFIEGRPNWLASPEAVAERSREMLRWIAACDYESLAHNPPRLGILIRISSEVARSLREAVFETQSDLLLLESPQLSSPRRFRLEAIVHDLIANPPCNVVVARPHAISLGQRFVPRSVLAPLRGGANARLAVRIGAALARGANARLFLLHIYQRGFHAQRRRYEEEEFHQLVETVRSIDPVVVELVADDPAETIFNLGRTHDAVVLGAHHRKDRAGMLIGPGFAGVLNQLAKSVFVARAVDEERF